MSDKDEKGRELQSPSIRIVGLPRFSLKRDVLRKVSVRASRVSAEKRRVMRTENVLLISDGQQETFGLYLTFCRVGALFWAVSPFCFACADRVLVQVAEFGDASKVVEVVPMLDNTRLVNYRAEWAVTFGTVADARVFLNRLNEEERARPQTDPRLHGHPMHEDALKAVKAIAAPFVEGRSYLVLRNLPEEEDRLRLLKARLTQSCKFRAVVGSLEGPGEGRAPVEGVVALEMASEADCLQMVAVLDGQRLVAQRVAAPDLRRVRPLKAAHLLF